MTKQGWEHPKRKNPEASLQLNFRVFLVPKLFLSKPGGDGWTRTTDLTLIRIPDNPIYLAKQGNYSLTKIFKQPFS
jgi:hypothetical protein